MRILLPILLLLALAAPAAANRNRNLETWPTDRWKPFCGDEGATCSELSFERPALAPDAREEGAIKYELWVLREGQPEPTREGELSHPGRVRLQGAQGTTVQIQLVPILADGRRGTPGPWSRRRVFGEPQVPVPGMTPPSAVAAPPPTGP